MPPHGEPAGNTHHLNRTGSRAAIKGGEQELKRLRLVRALVNIHNTSAGDGGLAADHVKARAGHGHQVACSAGGNEQLSERLSSALREAITNRKRLRWNRKDPRQQWWVLGRHHHRHHHPVSDRSNCAGLFGRRAVCK